jgi:uncharacterized protein (DUF2236 family)
MSAEQVEAIAREVERFSREGALLLGGGHAILLQVADPVVGAAVAEHSDFAHRPQQRLNNTLTFVYGTMLGTPEQAKLVAESTTRAHRHIPGANEPARQLWVAATLYFTAVRVYERLHGPLDATAAEQVLAAYAALATALDVPSSMWPTSVDAFADYWAHSLTTLEIGDHARQVAHDLFHPVSAPLWLRWSLPLAGLLTASLLEPPLREGYRMPWSRRRARRARASWALIRVLAAMLPARILAAPSRHYLRALAASHRPVA